MGMTMTQKILAAHCGLEKVEAGGFGALEIDEKTGRAGDGSPVLGEGLPHLRGKAHRVLGQQFHGNSPPN